MSVYLIINSFPIFLLKMNQLGVSISDVYSLANKTEKDFNTYKRHTEDSLKLVSVYEISN